MKLFDTKRIIIIGTCIILGLIFAAYLIHDQTGEFGSTGFISLGLTLVIAVTIAFVMIKRGNK